MFQFGGEGSENGKLKSPRGLAVHNHKVYVADFYNKRISVFQIDGKFHHTIGSGQLGDPHDVTVNGNNQLLVADYAHHCIYTHLHWMVIMWESLVYVELVGAN